MLTCEMLLSPLLTALPDAESPQKEAAMDALAVLQLSLSFVQRCS